MSETATENLDEALPPTAHEKASAYEGASDDRIENDAPEASVLSSTLPEGTATSATVTSPDSSATSEPPTAQDSSEPAPSPDSSEPATLPDSSAPLLRMRLQNSLRLRMKVWTDPSTLKRYLMPTGFMRDLVNGQPVSDAMYAYAMSDDDTRLIELTATEWNSLPFFYFQEDGYALRAAVRPMDILP